MPEDPSAEPTGLRLAELIAALSLGTDLGTGQPLERGIRACLVATQLADRLGLSAAERSDVYYLPLLAMLGCTADSDAAAAVFGDELAFGAGAAPFILGQQHEMLRWMLAHFGEQQPLWIRAGMVARALAGGAQVMARTAAAHCEVAQALSDRLGFGAGVRVGLGAIYSRWDKVGDAMPLAARIMHVAWDAQLFYQVGGPDACLEMARARAGQALDPMVVDELCRGASEILEVLNASSVWDAVLAAEPAPVRTIEEAHLDEFAAVLADFTDLKSKWLHGHSRRVAELAAEAARRRGLASPDVDTVRRAGLVHDLGRVGVSAGVWDSDGPPGQAERERIRLHPYFTERILAQAPRLAVLARIAGAHHERLDGSGYHRGSTAQALSMAARLLAAADVYAALTSHRPYRPAHAPEVAAATLREQVLSGHLDHEASEAVLAAAGHAVGRGRRAHPGGLSEREVNVLRLIARGRSNREMAEALTISQSTVHHHVQHIYDKLGVSTRAAATLFAMQNDLLTDVK
jgi:HD-GYP domain-containing protein (c-di-GMP phosphodiesterase class II)/DNA-binding CsgD family transcriptional regulator